MNMSYDGTERRVYRKDIVSGVTTEVLYLHDGMNAIVEKDKNGNSTEYVYGPTGIIFIKTATQTNFVLKDHLGSIRATINTAELPYAAVGYDYSAFGTILSTVSNSGYFYTGQEYDKTSGLHNFKARMYDSDLAMFYGTDPAGQYSSPYTYVGNNPVIRRDPSGNFSIKFDFKNLIPGYAVYSFGRNIVSAYNNAGGGLYGIGMAFSVANRSIISAGYAYVIQGVTGQYLPIIGIEGGLPKEIITGAAGGGAASAPSGSNFLNAVAQGAALNGASAIAGRFFSRTVAALNESINSSSNNQNFVPPDPEFANKALEEMKLYGGEEGILQYEEIVTNNTAIKINNEIKTYAQYEAYDSWWNFVIGRKDPAIYLNASRLFNPTLDVETWNSVGISSYDYLSKTVEALYHESGHLYGLPSYVNGVMKRLPNAQITHGFNSHTMFQYPIGELTKAWLQNVFVPNLHKSGVICR
ncbi:RHS repeat-associated core domain-containing protein [bacterium]|nr:RHS repeat-associated core domain-containing protein [bacterium]